MPQCFAVLSSCIMHHFQDTVMQKSVESREFFKINLYLM